KSRSANVGVVFAHQALGDLKALGDSVANAILTNSNVKVFMRGNDPDSAEYFSKVIGTKGTVKYTERQKIGFWTKEKSGDVSAREVEEFVIHPNHFKRELGVGQGVVVIPHPSGAKTCRVNFQMFPDLPVEKPLPRPQHPCPVVLNVPVKASSEEKPFLEELKKHQRKEVA
ncbi:TraM recognition domain-containing protein, partial [Bdellovibrionota bacterium FG-2]